MKKVLKKTAKKKADVSFIDKMIDMVKYAFSKHSGDELTMMLLFFLLIIGAYKTGNLEVAKTLAATFAGGVLTYIKGKKD